jgi:hypothetical protein
MFCSSLGTPFAASVAGDLNKTVTPWLNAQKFQKGGAHYLRSNVRSYSTGRGQTVGASHLYNTEEQTEMETSFSKDDGAIGVNPAVLPAGAADPSFGGIVNPPAFPHNSILPPVFPLQFPPVGGNKVPPVKIKKQNQPTLSKKRTRR